MLLMILLVSSSFYPFMKILMLKFYDLLKFFCSVIQKERKILFLKYRISYLLLHNKLPHTWQLKNDTNILFYSVLWSVVWIQGWLAEFCAQGLSHKIEIKLSTGAAISSGPVVLLKFTGCWCN